MAKVAPSTCRGALLQGSARPRPPIYNGTRSICPSTSAFPPVTHTCPQSRSQGRMFHGTTRHGSAAPFEYKVAAAFSGKRNVFDKAKHHFNFDSATSSEQWGDPTPIQRGLNISSGQDGFFAGQIGNTKATACAVADGVGGYQDSGIDSAAFAHGLCKHLKQSAKGFPEPFRDTTDQLKPLELLKRGYEKVCKDASIAGGGSTACVAVAQPDGMLHVAK